MTRLPRRTIKTLTLTFLFAAGCGGGGSTSTGSGPPGVDGSKEVTATTAADKMSVCDWYANLVGGYGAPSSCPLAVLQAPPSQADCTSQFPSCAVTVSDFAACVVAMIDAQNQCTQAAIDAAEASTACATVLPANCFGM
ncbi:MAG TPA: hypothetical protein VLA14_18525 [Polyangia bacterium]|nr:hypothetical protein [Polyangia bacterium]